MSTSCPIEHHPGRTFSHEAPEHATGWRERFRDLRDTAPVSWSDEHGGFWVVTSYADCGRIARDQTTFSSEKLVDPVTGDVSGGILIPANPGIRSVPIESNQAEWKIFRDILNPHFAPAAVERRRARIEAYADLLINRVIETGKADLVNDLTSPFPAMIALDILGLPIDDWKWWAEPFHEMIYAVKGSPEFLHSLEMRDQILVRLDEEITRRRTQPGDDILTVLVQSEPYGEPATNELVLNVAFLLLVAGSDTSTALGSNALLHLHRDHAARRFLIDNPDKIDVAREELLRYFSPVQTMARTVTKDVELGGQQLRAGDRVLMAYASANQDSAVFTHPDVIDLQRFPNRHYGFGVGIHRCLGSFIAKLSFNTLIGKILRHMPDYVVDEAASRPYTSVASINGWIDMPATFTPGKAYAGGEE